MSRSLPFSWTCDYCNQATTITESNYKYDYNYIAASTSKYGALVYTREAIICPNTSCRELTFRLRIGKLADSHISGKYLKEEIFNKTLLPESNAKPQPDYIPEEVRANYREACLIKDLSPKASAAMSRRCLQGMVRDFWEIPLNKRGNLGAELAYIKDKIPEDDFEAINVIRSIGDIGAHMEKDVNIIINVNPDEANALIELIETLFQDWYVAKQEKQVRLEKLKNISVEKREQQREGKKITKAKKPLKNTT